MELSRPFRALHRRLALMVSRAVISLVNDSLKLQGVQLTLLAGEVADVERFQEFGFTSVPPTGAEAIAVAVGGARSHLVVVATDDRRFRPGGMAAGEVAIYDLAGSVVLLKADGTIEATPAGGLVKVTGDLEVTGDVQDGTGTMQDIRDVFNAHVHPENNGVGGPNTNPPTTQM